MEILRSALFIAACLSRLAQAIYQDGNLVSPCDSPIYCQGEILKQIELARPYVDSKTFVDLPTIRPLDEVIAAFGKLAKPLSNNTELNTFLSSYFGKAGSELAEVPPGELRTDPVFLNKVNDTVIQGFVREVIDIWPHLTRRYIGAGNCTGCVDSFIPIKRPFVVAGGRFRECYYWDTYWILLGLLRTGGSFTEIARNMVENFLDFVEQFGFVPNGARIYYLNRSQPPLLAQMVKVYVDYTADSGILERAVPLLVKEHDFWMRNRSVDVGCGGKTYRLNRYAVDNNQPRPESYREDYMTANNASYYALSGRVYPEPRPLNETERASLHANLASGAESGWDYSSRWLADPSHAINDDYFPLRSLDTVNTVAVDLNSILYANEVVIGRYLDATGNKTGAAAFAQLAVRRSKAMHALMWNETYFSYFDYNLTSRAQNRFVPADADTTALQKADAPAGLQLAFSIAQLYPFWLGAAPPRLRNSPRAVMRAFARVTELFATKRGGIAATNLVTGQQWDQRNVWPNLMHILIAALADTPAPRHGRHDRYYVQTQEQALGLAQRYLDTTFCTWNATGGSTASGGIMFEKYDDDSINLAGSGGEYQVVQGFGWTNGVLIWLVDRFADKLQRPDCGNSTAIGVRSKRDPRKRSALELHPFDASWVNKF